MTPITKSMLSAALISGLLSTAMTLPATAADSIKQQVYSSQDFGRIAQHIRTDLRRQGYHVMNIKADDYNNKPALEVYAKKGSQAYEFKYSFPQLKLLESKQKAWSQLWHDDNQPDQEDKIKKSMLSDPNFETIKAKAIQKIEAMGYKVDDINTDDYRQKPIFEIEAERGNEEYEIRLAYPSLDILTVEED